MTLAGGAPPSVHTPAASGFARFHMRVALFVLVVVTVSNASGVLAASGVPVYSLALALASASLVLGVATKCIPLRLPGVVFLYAVTVTCMVPAVVGAQDGLAAWAWLLEHLKELWFLVVVVLLAAATSSAMSIVRTMSAVLSALAGLTVLNEFVLGNSTTFGGFSVVSHSLGEGTTTPRYQGPFDDPNFFGRILVLVFPLVIMLIAEAWTRRARHAAAAWSVCALLLVGGIYLTGSRGAMVGLAFASVVWMAAAGARSRRAIVLVPVLVVLALLIPGVGSRLASLSELSPGPPTFVERDGSLVERTAAQEVTWSIFTHNPLFGIGPGNASSVWHEYSTAGGGGIIREVAPHNFFLQVLGETGVVGMLGWLVLLLGAVVIAVRAVRARPVAPRAPPDTERLLAAAATASVIGWIVTSFFLHAAQLRLLLLVVAVIGLVSLRMVPRAQRESLRPFAVSRGGAVLASVTAGALVLALGAVGYRVFRTEEWVTEIPVALVPAAGPRGVSDAYRQHVTASRGIVATYAAVVDRIGQPLAREAGNMRMWVVAPHTSTGSRVATVFFVRVQGPDRERVENLARDVAARGSAYVDNSPALVTLARTNVGTATSFRAGGWSLPIS